MLKFKHLFFSSLTYLLTNSLAAEMPKNLQGTWKLDRTGTSELYRNSPSWNEKKERYLGDIIDYIGRYTFIFKEDKIERHFYQEILFWDLHSSNQDSTVFTFNSKNKEGKEQEVQITRMGADLIHIRIGSDDNYRLCAWRKQAPQVKKEKVAPPSLEELLEKMMQEEGRGTQEI